MSLALRKGMTAAIAEPAGESLLLARTATGDREAFRDLYFMFHRRLARFLLRLTRRPEVAEEIINDTMLVVWQRAAEFRGDSHVSTWILGIAYRRALKTLNRETRHDASAAASMDEPLPLDPATLSGLAHQAELSDWLDSALARLSPPHRLVIELAHVLGLSCEEIAQVVDCPVNTVKTRMFYARQHLRAELATLATPMPSASSGAESCRR